MTPELLKEAFREMSRDVPTPDMAERAHQLVRRGRRRRLAGPLVAALAVSAVVLGSVLFVGRNHQPGPAARTVSGATPGIVAVPTHIPTIAQQPLDRAGMLLGIGETETPVVVSSDGTQYRRLGATEKYPPSVFSLSPDGTRVAYSGRVAATALNVLDLANDLVVNFPLPGTGKGESVTDLIWSPDNTEIAYSAGITTDVSTDGSVSSGQGEDDAILNLTDGAHTHLPGRPLDWSADGQQLLLDQPGAGFVITDITGKTLRTIPADATTGTELVFPRLWSADQHLLATILREDTTNTPATDPHQYRLQLLADTTGQPTGIGHVELGTFSDACEVLGWHDPTHVLVSEPLSDGVVRVMSIDVHTGTATAIEQTTPGSNITFVQLAADAATSG